jgi:ABC-type sugar transport system permease subunit
MRSRGNSTRLRHLSSVGLQTVGLAVPPKLRRHLWGYFFIAPAMLFLGIFVLWPMVYALVISFFDYGVTGAGEFLGVTNYVGVLHDELFWKSLLVTSVYTVGSAAIGLSTALSLAVLVTQKLPFMGWFRVLYFIPSVTSLVVIAFIFSWMLDYNLGLFNYWLTALHIGKVPWLQNGQWALASLILIGAWGGASYNLPIYAAGIQSVSRDLYEAATLDGAGGWRRFLHITLPAIAPITRYTVIMAIIASFQVIATVDVLTNGGPGNATLVTIKYVWQQGWEYLHFGYGSAITVFMLIFLFVITWQQLRDSRG